MIIHTDVDGNIYSLLGTGAKVEIEGTVHTVVWENIVDYLQYIGITDANGRECTFVVATDEKGLWGVTTVGGKKLAFREVEQVAPAKIAECDDLLAQIRALQAS